MRKETKQNLALVFVSFILFLLLIEITMRFFIEPSPHSFGNFFGHELPPLKMFPYSSPPTPTDRSAWYGNLIVDGQKISKGDLWGFYRKDPVLGYAPQEGVTSLNEWWQSNSVGARKRTEISKEKPMGLKRILVFGDSFAHGSRVRQEEVWTHILDSENNRLEVINFGVDGYSMAQTFLWYQKVQKIVDYDTVLLMFVPSADLWRDINMRRDLGETDWHLDSLMPRFILEHGELKLIRSPVYNDSGQGSQQLDVLREENKEYLETYDQFYFKTKFEEPWLIGKSVFFKFLITTYHKYLRDKIRNSVLQQNSEALQISKKIFETMHDEMRKNGKDFILTLLPLRGDLDRFKHDPSYKNDWDRMTSSLCDIASHCIDLSKDLQTLPESEWDNGYDGTHFGPKTNRQIAEYIRNHLERMNLF
jgi:hypothetical protein